MMADVKNDSGISILRPRARLLRTFGDELISSEIWKVIAKYNEQRSSK